jgi:hypothetical protein
MTKPGATRYCKPVESGYLVLGFGRVACDGISTVLLICWNCRPGKKRAFALATGLAEGWPVAIYELDGSINVGIGGSGGEG